MHKIIFFLRTLYYSCSYLRTIRAFLVLALSPLWGLLRYIPIGLWVVLLLSSLFPPSSSLALEANPQSTPVPTSTFVPLFPTSTPVPTLDYSCNGQQVAGWGTVTPDAYWYLNCSQCVTPNFPTSTPEPQSTFTTSLTQTALPLITPTVTYTPISTPVIPLISCGVGYFTCENVSLGHVRLTTSVVLEKANTSQSIQNSNGTYIYYVVNVTENGGVHSRLWDAIGFPAYSAVKGIYEGVYEFAGQYSTHSGIDNYYYVPAGIYEFTGTMNGGIDFGSPSGAGTDTRIQAGGVIIDLYSYPPSVGTATPVPSSSYCSSVVPSTGDGGDVCEEGVFCSPVPSTGSASCPIDIGSVTIPLSLLGFSDVVIPSISICLVPIYFGQMIVWGMTIDLDYIGYVMSGVAIVRMILRS